MSNYVLGVVSHVDRHRQREHLRDILSPEYIGEDDGSLGVMGNHLKVISSLAVLSVSSGAEWVVVLEDDAEPQPGFHRQLNAALDVAPSPVASLYLGTGYPQQKQRKFADAVAHQDVCWIMHEHMRCAVAYALRRECFELGIIERMVELHGKRWAPDDAIGKWAKEHCIPVAYSNPSIVDHEDGPPVVKFRRHRGHVTPAGRKRPRKAHWVGTRLTWDDKSATV